MTNISTIWDIAGVLTPKRILNIILLYTGYVLSVLIRKPVVLGRPFSVSIEPVANCNLSCPQCPTGLKMVRRNTMIIKEDRYRRIVDEVAPTAIYLMLYFQGEPLMHNEFGSLVGYAKKKKLYTVTSTNGQLLDERQVEGLVASGLNELIVSVDGTTDEVYRKYRQGGHLSKVLRGIELLVEQKEKTGSSTPKIEIQFIVFSHNQHQVDDIKKLGAELGADRVSLKSPQLYLGRDAASMLPDNPRYRRYNVNGNGELVIARRMLNRCRRIWDTAVFTADAELVSCCYDKEGSHKMGSLMEVPFHELWKSTVFRDFRKRILSDRKSVDICNNCSEGLGRKIRNESNKAR